MKKYRIIIGVTLILIIIGGSFYFYRWDVKLHKDAQSRLASIEFHKLENKYRNNILDPRFINPIPVYPETLYRAALGDYSNFVKMYPDSKWTIFARFAIGRMHEELGNYDEAIKERQAIIKDYPSSQWAVMAQYGIASIYRWKLKDYPKAKKEFQKILDNYPESNWIKMVRDDIKQLEAKPR